MDNRIWRGMGVLLLLIFLSTPLSAHTVDCSHDVAKEELSPEEEESRKRKSGMTPHKPNFAIPFSVAGQKIEGRQEKEIKFQVSFKQFLFDYSDFEFYIAYTQKSFWQMYDLENSRPFRETNYNPEAFIRTPQFAVENFGKFTGYLGYEHESNGMKEPYSRSWDRVYVQLEHKFDMGKIRYKFWHRLPDKKKEYPGDPEGDENPDILDYYGVNQLFVDLQFGEAHVKIMGRRNISRGRGAVQVDLIHPMFFVKSMYWFLQYWDGYGESLTDYDRHLTKWGLGMMFSL